MGSGAALRAPARRAGGPSHASRSISWSPTVPRRSIGAPLGRGKSVVGLGRRPTEGYVGGLTGGPRGAFLGDGTDPTTYRHLFNVNLLYIMIM